MTHTVKNIAGISKLDCSTQKKRMSLYAHTKIYCGYRIMILEKNIILFQDYFCLCKYMVNFAVAVGSWVQQGVFNRLILAVIITDSSIGCNCPKPMLQSTLPLYFSLAQVHCTFLTLLALDCPDLTEMTYKCVNVKKTCDVIHGYIEWSILLSVLGFNRVFFQQTYPIVEM